MAMKGSFHKVCPNCGKETQIVEDADKLQRWRSGEHIQNVWPEKTPIERETMITGICSDKCWDEFLGPEE